MYECRLEPRLDDLLDDPILGAVLECDRLSRDDLNRLIEQARRALIEVPRQWQLPQVEMKRVSE